MNFLALAELEERRKRAERQRMDHEWRRSQPGYPEYASGAIDDLATVDTLSSLGLPVVSDAADTALATDAAMGGRWGDAAIYGAAAAVPFVAGPALKAGVDAIGRRIGDTAVGNIPMDPELVELEAMRQTLPGQGQLEAPYGIKRHPAYYHGTPTMEARDAILEQGFVRGKSAELNLPGTSLSEDPTVSSEVFAGGRPGNVLRVDVDVPPERVRNLRPSEYLGGVAPEPGAVYRKPNLFFKEAETFGVRGEEAFSVEQITKKQLELQDAEKKMLEAQSNVVENPGNAMALQAYQDAENKWKGIAFEMQQGNVSPPPFKPRKLDEMERVQVDRAAEDQSIARSAFTKNRNTPKVGHRAPRAARDVIQALMSVQGNRAAALEVLDNLNPTTLVGEDFWMTFKTLAGQKEHDRLGRLYQKFRRLGTEARATADDRLYREAMRAKDELVAGLRPYASVKPRANRPRSIPGPIPASRRRMSQ